MVRPADKTKLDFSLDIEFDDILTNPILDIAARFWEADRYEAFQICYRSMRIIDDLVDNRKAGNNPVSNSEFILFDRMITDWLDSLQQGKATDSFQKELLRVIRSFSIPLWPWKKLADAMRYDLKHDGFPSLLVFLRYCEGAAIAPASIFMHLCGISRQSGSIVQPPFDIRKAARPLALFSYFVHIIRDFQKDQQDNLNYFADGILAKEHLTREDLIHVATGGKIPQSFRAVVLQYRNLADYYRKKARRTLDHLFPYIPPRYQLSLELIYGLYLQIFERIRPDCGNFDTKELNPSPEEVKKRIDAIVSNFDPK